jgi:hypothetical protein
MHVNQSITARAMFSELMLGGATINSKAASAGRKGCHSVIIWEEKILQVAPAQKRKKMVLLAMPGLLLWHAWQQYSGSWHSKIYQA